MKAVAGVRCCMPYFSILNCFYTKQQFLPVTFVFFPSTFSSKADVKHTACRLNLSHEGSFSQAGLPNLTGQIQPKGLVPVAPKAPAPATLIPTLPELLLQCSCEHGVTAADLPIT